jgi:hypothetical protein
VCLAKLAANETYLRQRYPAYDDWPADAQLGLLSMSWAMGPGFKFPAFDAAVTDLDFARAATVCSINSTNNPGVVPRNAANKQLFGNAAAVGAWALDPDVLWYPGAPPAP